MTSTNTVTTWRELAGELTSAQVADLAFREDRYGTEPGWPQLLVEQAQAHVAGNRRDSERFGHIPAPAGAINLEHWEVDPVEGGFLRYFSGAHWEVEGIDAGISGTQYPDGRIERAVRIESDGQALDADQLRLIAAALCEAADELDKHDGGNPYPVDSTVWRCCRAIGRHGKECDPRLRG